MREEAPAQRDQGRLSASRVGGACGKQRYMPPIMAGFIQRCDACSCFIPGGLSVDRNEGFSQQAAGTWQPFSALSQASSTQETSASSFFGHSFRCHL